jgi:hypothetical protein
MTFNNSVLLMLKHSGSEEFNELLSKISSRYKNNSSAFASLSRSIKNLCSLGLVKKKGSRIFITDKGLASIQIEMREKLVLRLNELLKKPLDNIEEIVQLLIVFTERANESKDLLLNARENSVFSIKDISDLQEKIEHRKEFLDKMASLIGVQEERLRELNFGDSREFCFNDFFVKKLIAFSLNEKIVIETLDDVVLKKIPKFFRKENHFVIDNDSKNKVLLSLCKIHFGKFIIYVPKMKVIVLNKRATCYSLYKTLIEFEELK